MVIFFFVEAPFSNPEQEANRKIVFDVARAIEWIEIDEVASGFIKEYSFVILFTGCLDYLARLLEVMQDDLIQPFGNNV